MPCPIQLFRNLGNGRFEDRSDEVVPDLPGKGLGVLVADIDVDGDVDIYVANDTTDNFLFRNEGGRFQEVGRSSGVAVDNMGVANGSMGVDLVDFNRDGWPDIGVANYDRETFALYRQKEGMFLTAARIRA